MITKYTPLQTIILLGVILLSGLMVYSQVFIIYFIIAPLLGYVSYLEYKHRLTKIKNAPENIKKMVKLEILFYLTVVLFGIGTIPLNNILANIGLAWETLICLVFLIILPSIIIFQLKVANITRKYFE